MEATLRCKMRVTEVTHSIDSLGKVEQERIKLHAVTGGKDTENGQWSRWTPSASFEIVINNQSAFNKVSKGHEFYIDFIPCETIVVG